MRALCLLVLLTCPLSAQTQKPVKEFRVRIEGTALDSQMLIEKLNSHGEGHHLKFVATDGGFDFRMVFSVSQAPTNTAYGAINSSTATTSVFDSKGAELFEFKREARWTDSGAVNAVAKEIIKRLVKLRVGSK